MMGTLQLMNKSFDMFIYAQVIEEVMFRRDIWIRSAGGLIAGLGILLVVISGELGPEVIEGVGGKASSFMLRAGFSLFLIGIMTLFLMSFRSVPEELSFSFLNTITRNMGREIKALNLEGNGIYISRGIRLREDRVFIPLDRRRMQIPELNDESVFNTGDAGASIGLSTIPSGQGLVDEIERSAGSKFQDDDPMNAPESLEKMGRGTGLFGGIRIEEGKGTVDIEIAQTRFRPVCDLAWKEYPDLHKKIGCPACSAVLCASARIMKVPLRIESVERESNTVRYRLRREG